jgi:competence protein ComEC
MHIVTPDGVEVLIDGGPDASVLRELQVERSFFDRHLDLVIATHPDTDHVGGLVDVLARYEVAHLLETAAEHDAPAAKQYLQAAAAEGATRYVVDSPMSIRLGASTTLRVLAPQGDTRKWRSNAASIVVQLQYGDTEFLFTGDAMRSIERYLVEQYGETLESEVLKLGHHGSDTSTSDALLAAVTPAYAVVSAGAENRYGHPHPAVVERVTSRNIELFSTATHGTIEFHSDGTRVWRVE